MRIEFHPEALAEFEDTARYYADCQDGLELRFITRVEFALSQIQKTPDRWRIFEEDVRRCLTRGHALSPRTGLLATSSQNEALNRQQQLLDSTLSFGD